MKLYLTVGKYNNLKKRCGGIAWLTMQFCAQVLTCGQ